MSRLAVANKLLHLLTKETISNFDRAFDVLTDPSTHTYAVFWNDISDKYPMFNDHAKTATYHALITLRSLLRQYRETLE